MQRIPLLLMVVALGVALAAAVVQLSAGAANVAPLWILAVSLGLGSVLLVEDPETNRR